MRYSGAYALVLVLHLLSVVFLVGPAAVAGIASARHARAGNAQALRDGSRTTRLYTLLTVVAVLLGSVLVGSDGVGEQWDMAQLWVSASYALWLVAVVVTLVVVVPAQVAAARALDEGGDGARYAGRIAAGAGVAVLAWTALIVLMVVKPGA